MNRAFADAFYWIAVTMPEDQWHIPANEVRQTLGQAAEIVTTEEVLTEFLAAVSRAGIGYRRKAVLMVRAILTDENILVLSQSHESFMAGLDLYERRADKGYSLTDCISMNTCRSEVITDILTNDHHFTQEGFNVLISR